MAIAVKSLYMYSTTGRIPVIAAPTAAPVNPCSLIGVWITRSAPKIGDSPSVTL